MNKIIITAALCGAEVTLKDTPHVPISPLEIAQEARRCLDAGASIIHLHVRDNKGIPTQKLEYFKRAFKEIIKRCNILPIIQPSTGGAVGMNFTERSAPLKLLPEMATLDCGTINFGDEIFVNDHETMKKFAVIMKRDKIMPELECFEIGHIHNALRLADEKMIQGHLHFDFVLGVRGAMNATGVSLFQMVESIPQGATWSVAGIGRDELPLAFISLGLGGHVRVGLEDNIYYSKGVLSRGSAPLVERIARLARELGREPATPDEARKILKIPLNRKNDIKIR